MRFLRLAILASAAAVASLRYPTGLTSIGLAPDWLLLPALLLALVARRERAVVLAFGFGLVADLLSVEPFGLRAFLFALAGWTVSRVRDELFSDHPLTQAATGFVVALLISLAALVRLEMAEPSLAFLGRLPAAFLSAVLTGMLLPVLAEMDRRLGITRGFRREERRV